jgi:hypothetical protein
MGKLVAKVRAKKGKGIDPMAWFRWSASRIMRRLRKKHRKKSDGWTRCANVNGYGTRCDSRAKHQGYCTHHRDQGRRQGKLLRQRYGQMVKRLGFAG